MSDWLKIAREVQLQDELDKHKHKAEEKNREKEIRESEENWMERMNQRIQQIADQMVHIGLIKRPNGLELTGKEVVGIQMLGHQNFAIKYYNIMPATTITMNRPIKISHHRLVRVREMNNHNIEEILKFVALGMEKYIQISSHQRVERNLHTLLESVNLDERA